MKKIIALVLSLSMLFCFLGCMNQKDGGETSSNSNTESEMTDSANAKIFELENEIEELKQELKTKDDEQIKLEEKVERLQIANEQAIKSKDYEALLLKYKSYKAVVEKYNEFLQDEEGFVKAQKNMPTDLPVYKDGDVELDTEYWHGDKFKLPYRYCYYWSFMDILGLVGRLRGYDGATMSELDVLYKERFFGEFNEETGKWSRYPEEIPALTVIKELCITREEIDAIYDEYMEADENIITEKEEIKERLNFDILYTFNQDIINEYYRRA